MTFQNPAVRILRRSVAGMEGMHSKMFDPPTASPATPEFIDPTAPPVLPPGVKFNPVPEIMAALGLQTKNPPSPPHTVQLQLMHGMNIPTWDLRPMQFFVFRNPDGINEAKDGSFPAMTVRAPRG